MEYNNGNRKWTHGEEMTGYNEWHILLGPCPACGTATFNYGGGWRCLAMYCFNNASNPVGNIGPRPEWWNKGVNVIKDGNMWMAHGIDFVNLQESVAEFAETPDKAAMLFLSKHPPSSSGEENKGV